MIRVTKLALFVVAAGVAACGDVVGPRAVSADSSDVQNVVGGNASVSLTQADTLQFSFTIDPTKHSTFYLGAGNTVIFPAFSVCDPTKTKYGEGFWDRPCKPLQRLLTVSVKAWLDSLGHPRTDFSPGIRFVPSDVPSRWVNIEFADQAAALDPSFNILYATDEHAKGKNDAKSDPTLITVRNPVTGQLTRRIKHFSGYLVGAGSDSTAILNKVGVGVTMSPSVSMLPFSTPTDQMFFKPRASGYILVSG